MVEHLIELIQKPRILHDLCRPPPKPKPVNTRNVQRLVERITERKMIEKVQIHLMEVILAKRHEVAFVAHLKQCRFCMAELMIDVERYCGSRTVFFVSLEYSECMEEEDPDCPRVKDYHIGNYWEQLKHYEKYGNTDVPGENTEQFILDRAKWAYKILGKQIHIARQILRLIRTWEFTDEQHQKFMELYDQLGMWSKQISFN